MDNVVILPKFGFSYDTWSAGTVSVFSDVVDKSNFTSVDNQRRAASAGFDSGSQPGLYDFDESGYNKIKDPDNLIIMIREGRLDRTEVEKARKILQNQMEQEVKAASEEKRQKKLQKMYENQLEVIDNYLNFKSDTESDSNNLLSNQSK